jgi:hypothetical protein
MGERDLNGFGAWDVRADGMGYRSEEDQNEDCSVREVAIEDVYISILAMAPPHRPSDVLTVRATLAVPVGRTSIALHVGGADSMYANVIWHRRSSMAPPVARPIATFGCPRTARELLQ